MRKWERRARAEIRNTIARYTWCGDFGDVEGFVSCFTPDAMLTVKDGAVFEGHEALARLARGEGMRAPPERAAAFGPLHHHVSSVRIEVESKQSGHAWAYFLVLGRHGLDHWGRYADELVPVGERWLFRRRRVSVDGAAKGSVHYPDGLS
ncbi:MAG TPA: nuclear transport factor 2 family protein [Myxococcota bacterium]|nr:nuclear transport factor 2 family protein [Myxococcota bacterium]